MSLRYLAAAAFLALAADPSGAFAQAPQSAHEPCGTNQAVEHFQRGLGLFEQRNPSAALFEFELAYECAPNFRVLYNIAVTKVELNDYAGAWHSYNRYLSEGGSAIEVERRQQVEVELARIRSLIGTIAIAVNIEGAEIRIDGDVIGNAPLPEPVAVNIGRHQIMATARGYEGQSRTVGISAGDRAEVRLELVEQPETPATAPQPQLLLAPPPEEDTGPDRTAFWIALGGTGLLAAGTGVAFGLTLSADSKLDDERGTFPSSEEDIEDARSDVRTWSTVADVLGAATLVTAAVTVLLYLSTGDDTEEMHEDDASRAGRPEVTGNGVLIRF